MLSLLVIVAASLGGGVSARSSEILNRDQATVRVQEQKASAEQKKLKQESTYGGYYVPEEPFSTTEDYGKFNAFLIGAKFSETYTYTDDCINNIVWSIDENAYFKNNKTEHRWMMENGTRTTYFEPYLNVTGSISGPIADSLPNCYNFLYSIYTVEETRFQSFNNNWGDFFLAFLFNQMGKALSFQTKFQRIEEMKERQNYLGIWQEYGDLLYLIWTFSPINDGAIDDMRTFVERWFAEHDWLADDMPAEYKEFATAATVTAGRLMHSWGTTFGEKVEERKVKFHEKRLLFAEKIDNFRDKVAEIRKEPEVGAAPTGFNAATDWMNGYFEGLVDVFPYESNPQRCRNNFTVSYDAVDRLFVKGKDNGGYDWAGGWGDETFQENIIQDIAYLLKWPFGASYSCYWGFSTVVIEPDPYEDGVLTEDEELELLIKLGLHTITNLFFNAGYIYADSFALYDLFTNQKESTLFYKNMGIYFGDITIRFFWRRRFTRNFDYE